MDPDLEKPIGKPIFSNSILEKHIGKTILVDPNLEKPLGKPVFSLKSIATS